MYFSQILIGGLSTEISKVFCRTTRGCSKYPTEIHLAMFEKPLSFGVLSHLYEIMFDSGSKVSDAERTHVLAGLTLFRSCSFSNETSEEDSA